MGYHFGRVSLSHKKDLHPRLQLILDDAIEIMDITILCGYRNEIEQNIAFDAGRSKKRFPESKHNRMPARAVDIAPYPIDWEDIARFREMGMLIKGIAHARGIKIRWGGDWQKLKDYPHVELED